MSIKLLVESIETARVNNQTLGMNFGGKLVELLDDVIAAKTETDAAFAKLTAKIEALKFAFANEIEERDRDLIRLMEGAA